MTATDDRNNPCDVAAPTRRQLGLRALGLETFYDPHTRQELASTGKLELTIALVAAFVGAVLWQLAWQAFPIRGLLGLCGGFVVVPSLVATGAWWLSLGAVRRHKFRRLTDIYLSTSRCPACAYRLTGLETEYDGCVVCPECGAAWRADRVEQGDSPQRHGDTEQ